MAPAPAAGLHEILTFEVEGRTYALPASRVRELIRAVAVEPLPGAPPIVEGIINVRGEVVPVVDLRRRLGLPAKPAAPADHLILAWAGTQTVALHVDRVIDLMRLAADRFEDLRGIVPGLRDLSGVAKLPDGLLLIQDVRALLTDAEGTGLLELLSQPTLWDRIR